MGDKKCFKFPHEIEDNLNLTLSITNQIIAFWNKYQIFLLNKEELGVSETDPSNWQWIFFNTEFAINQLILSNNHVICLDDEDNVFAYALKLKQISHKRPKVSFQKLECDILCMDCVEELLFCIKLKANKLQLSINKVNNDFTLHKQNIIDNENLLHLPSDLNRKKCMLSCFKVNKSDIDTFNNIFSEKIKEKQIIVIISIDKLTLYALLIDLGLDIRSLNPIKLLTCPSEINNIDMIREDFLNLIICLRAGTVLKLPLNDKFKSPNIVHLNTAIDSFLIFDHKIIYSDSNTMWSSMNTFSKTDQELRQLFVKQIKDFIKIDDRIICTTYSKLFYIFNLNDESSYLVGTNSNKYDSAEHLFSNMNYMQRIMEEVEKNHEIIKNIKVEEDYITTFALSNRQDFMTEIIQYNVNVYENYEDILKEGVALYLTNNLKDYFDTSSFQFLINIVPNDFSQQNGHDILSNIFTDSKIYITILSRQRNIKTISFKIVEQLKLLNIVIPVSMEICNVTDIVVETKIVKKIPKVFDSTENLWITLYSKQILLTPEHFIKTNDTPNKIRLLKDPEDSIEDLIYKTAYKHHGHLFRITKASEEFCMWSFFIKLPNTYKQLLQNKMFFEQHFNSTKAKYLLKEMSSEEFLNSRRTVSFNILREKLDIEIVSDGFFKILKMKVSSTNPVLALELRNIFANLIHNNYQTYQPGQEFLSCIIFKTLEKTENAVRKYLDAVLPFEEFQKIYEKFQTDLSVSLV